MRWVLGGLMLAWGMSCTGCATVLGNKNSALSVDNKFGPTYFAIKDHKQKLIHEGITPQKVTLASKRAPFVPAKYQIEFVGENNSTDRQEIKPGFEPWTVGNVLLGGIPGLVVDGATGAMFKMPKEVIGHVPSVNTVADNRRGFEIMAGGEKPPSSAVASMLPEANSEPSVRTASAVQAEASAK